jgi:predicted Zn-dependent peptidase
MPRTYHAKVGLELGIACLSQYLFEELRAKRGLVYSVEAFLDWGIPGHVFMECHTATDLNKLSKTQQFLQNILLRFPEQGLSTERVTNMKMSEVYDTIQEQEDISSSGEWLWDAYEEKQTDADPYKMHLETLERLSVESIKNTTKLNVVGTHKLGKLIAA